MRVESADEVKAFTIYDAQRWPGRGMIDPITVMLRDFGGSGQVIVECYGAAWSCWFNAIGSETLRRFLACCDHDYLASKLATCSIRRTTKREEEYLQDIARAVIAAVKGEPS